MRERSAPLRVGHGRDGLIVRGPDAVVDDQAVEPPKGRDRGGDQGAAVFRRCQRLLDGAAKAFAAKLGGEGFGAVARLLVAEDDAGAGLAKQADGGSADAARAPGDEDDFTFERKNNTSHAQRISCCDAIAKASFTEGLRHERLTLSSRFDTLL